MLCNIKQNEDIAMLNGDDKHYTLWIASPSHPDLANLLSLLDNASLSNLLFSKGKHMLEQIKTQQTDLILIDSHLEDISAFELCAHLKTNPNSRQVPILFIADSSTQFDISKALQLGAADYVYRPCPKEEMLSRIRTHLCLSQCLQGQTEQLQDLHKQEAQIQHYQKELAQQKDNMQALSQALQQAKSAAEASDNTKTQFLANMSHELRTPMNAIIGYSEMLEEEALELEDKDFAHDLNKINASGKHLLALINDILDFSKIEAGHMDLYLENFSLHALLADIERYIRPRLQGNQLKIEPSDEVRMNADVSKLRQILLNLLTNACKFTHQGCVELSIRIYQQQQEDWIDFRVQDNGIGIAGEQKQNLFQAFTQIDASSTRQYGGTGLGLSISKRFAEMLGGDLQVESELDQGSCFILSLPLHSTATTQISVLTEKHNTQMTAKPFTPDEQKEIVLVINNDVLATAMVQNTIEQQGYHAAIAEGAEEGLALARSLKPVMITLDMRMPDADSWYIIQTLKQDPELSNTPIFMMSINQNGDVGYRLKASGYLLKPVESVALNNILRTFAPHQPENVPTVLLAEDEKNTRFLLKRQLTKAGWHVLEAENGQVALDMLKLRRPDLILSDLMMPELDGFQLLDMIRNSPDWQHLPVVILTSKELNRSEYEFLNSRVEHVFQKGSYSRDELLTELSEAMLKIEP